MKKRVAIMVNSLRFGGAERIMADLSIYLENNGYDVHLLLMDDTDIAYKYGGKIHKISKHYKKNSIVNTLFTVQHFILTYNLKKKLKIDCTISAMEFLNFVNILTPCGDKIIATLHNHKLQCEVTPTVKDKLIECIFRSRLNEKHTIVAVSEEITNKLKKLYNHPHKNFITIYNAFNAEDIEEQSKMPLDAKISEFMTPYTFVNAARYVDQKSLDKLICAFSIVEKKYPEARLVLVGDGQNRETFSELSDSLGIRNKVMLTGFLENPFPVIRNSLAFVLSSHYEGFGNVIVEALACGKVVISTDCLCGPREILAPKTEKKDIDVELCEFGVLTKDHEGKKDIGVCELARAMEMVIENPDILKNYEGKARMRANDFSPDKVYKKWIDILS